jgi:hypothetical protein
LPRSPSWRFNSQRPSSTDKPCGPWFHYPRREMVSIYVPSDSPSSRAFRNAEMFRVRPDSTTLTSGPDQFFLGHHLSKVFDKNEQSVDYFGRYGMSSPSRSTKRGLRYAQPKRVKAASVRLSTSGRHGLADFIQYTWVLLISNCDEFSRTQGLCTSVIDPSAEFSEPAGLPVHPFRGNI